MIVAVQELKDLLGLTDTDEDARLERLILSATAYVEGATHQRFDTPIAHEEFHDGSGERFIFLAGHIDDENAADSAAEDPVLSLRVYRRSILEPTRDWEALIAGTDWERRGQRLLYLGAWAHWPRTDEIKLTYLNGYIVPPADIRQLVLELALDGYLTETAAAQGTAGITSESLGDYSYSVDLKFVTAGTGKLNDIGRSTINRYKRLLV